MHTQYILGIELGSTRIKSVLIAPDATVIAQGAYAWKSELRDGLWTYDLDEVWQGLQAAYAGLRQAYHDKTGEDLTEVAAIGISAMMHGYLAFDAEDHLLVPFRTWQNTNTAEAADELSDLFTFNIPQRWSVSHFYQAVLNGEAHVPQVAFLTTLAGYVHYRLTGRKVLGIGDASGMFPIEDRTYSSRMLSALNTRLCEKGITQDFRTLLPDILLAGDEAGTLTAEGAKLLDPTGSLRPGCVLCPPEGDAGTGMIATNSITPRTANVSAGTSAFLMAVLERDLSGAYREIDMVTTPTGAPVAMIHVNNFTAEINAWAALFEEVIALGGGQLDRGELFDRLYRAALDGDADCGGLVGYNFLAGEPIAGVATGAPLLMRSPDGRLTLPNLMKMHIYSALGSLALGMDILRQEQVQLDVVCGHGGFFKAGRVSAGAMSAAIGAPVTVMRNAGEGGAWGVALLALMTAQGEHDAERFLANIFAQTETLTVSADERERQEFGAFMTRYQRALPVERAAAENMTRK
ncbi:MAG: ATPase [Clostridia bacterium]|nr:ATPase [Clostridia bacterium]